MARSDYDIINLSLEHELNEWLAERGYAGLADNRNRLAEVVTRKLQDSFYINVSWGALVTVTSVEETRVVFMRDGYPHPCMRPMYNFR